MTTLTPQPIPVGSCPEGVAVAGVSTRRSPTIGSCRNFTETLEMYEYEKVLLHHTHRRSTGIRRARTGRNRERRSVRPVVCGPDAQPAAVPGLSGHREP